MCTCILSRKFVHLQKQFFTYEVRMAAAASMAEGCEILKSVRPLLKSLWRI